MKRKQCSKCKNFIMLYPAEYKGKCMMIRDKVDGEYTCSAYKGEDDECDMGAAAGTD